MCTVKCTFKARTARWVYQILIFLAVYVAYDHISFWQFAGIYMIYNTSIKYLIPIITFGACIVHLTVSCDIITVYAPIICNANMYSAFKLVVQGGQKNKTLEIYYIYWCIFDKKHVETYGTDKVNSIRQLVRCCLKLKKTFS